MMEGPLDETIRLSVEETDGFIDISRGRNKKERNEERCWEEEKPPAPSYESVTIQMRGAEEDDQPVSNIWKHIKRSLRQFGQSARDLLHHLYKCCFGESNICTLLLRFKLRCCRCAKGSCELIQVTARSAILKLVGYFTKKHFCQENQNSQGTDLEINDYC